MNNALKMLYKNTKAIVLWCLNLMQLVCEVESNTVKQDNQKSYLEMRYWKRAIDDEPIKYPKTHEITRAQVERFEKYYKCLNEFKMKPAVHYVFQGTSISLHCDACISHQGHSIQWTFANKATNFTENFVQSDRVVNKHSETLRSTQTEDGLILTLHGLSMDESGHYTCLQHGNVITPHLVQVANSSEKLYEVKPATSPEGPYASPTFNLTDLSVKVWFKWGEWSTCSRCDQVGKRIRIGICMVTIFENKNRTDAKVLNIFPEGIPCRSNLLPTFLQSNPRIQSANNEYMVETCKENCTQNRKYVLKDTGGILLKKIGNISDAFTLIKRLPSLSPPIKRSALYLNQWDTAHIQCPGGDHNDALVHWRLGLNLILTENERVQLSPTHVLVIKDLSISDSNVYSCWQRNRLVGVVRLTISQPIRLSFQEQLNTVALTAIIISIIIITLRFLREHLKRRRFPKTKNKTNVSK